MLRSSCSVLAGQGGLPAEGSGARRDDGLVAVAQVGPGGCLVRLQVTAVLVVHRVAREALEGRHCPNKRTISFQTCQRAEMFCFGFQFYY